MNKLKYACWFWKAVGSMIAANIVVLLDNGKRYRICEDPDELGYWLEEKED